VNQSFAQLAKSQSSSDKRLLLAIIAKRKFAQIAQTEKSYLPKMNCKEYAMFAR
jgi:hypothetical protein